MKTHTAHRRIKIERVYRPYLGHVTPGTLGPEGLDYPSSDPANRTTNEVILKSIFRCRSVNTQPADHRRSAIPGPDESDHKFGYIQIFFSVIYGPLKHHCRDST
jgi:hypothetical protein